MSPNWFADLSRDTSWLHVDFNDPVVFKQPIIRHLPVTFMLPRRALLFSNRTSTRTSLSTSTVRALPKLLPLQTRQFSMSDKKQEPTIDKISTLGEDEAKWTELKKIDWTDQTGRHRVWEAASRKNRGAAGVDAGKSGLSPWRAIQC